MAIWRNMYRHAHLVIASYFALLNGVKIIAEIAITLLSAWASRASIEKVAYGREGAAGGTARHVACALWRPM